MFELKIKKKRIKTKFKTIRNSVNNSDITFMPMKSHYRFKKITTNSMVYNRPLYKFLDHHIGKHEQEVYIKLKINSVEEPKTWESIRFIWLQIINENHSEYYIDSKRTLRKIRVKKHKLNVVELLELIKAIDSNKCFQFYIKTLNYNVTIDDIEIVGDKAKINLPHKYRKLYKRDYFYMDSKGKLIGIDDSLQSEIDFKDLVRGTLIYYYIKDLKIGDIVYNITHGCITKVDKNEEMWRSFAFINSEEYYCDYLLMNDYKKYIKENNSTFSYMKVVIKSVLNKVGLNNRFNSVYKQIDITY